MKKAIIILIILAVISLVAGCNNRAVLDVNREHITDVIWAIHPQYDKAFEFYSGLAMVSIDDAELFIDKTGANAFNKTFKKIDGGYSEFYSRRIPNVIEVGNNEAYRLNITGKIQQSHGSDIVSVFRIFENGLSAAKSTNGYYGLVNSIDQWVIEPTYSLISDIWADGQILPKTKDGFFNNEFIFVALPKGYEWAFTTRFFDGYAAVVKKNRANISGEKEYINFIDINGNLLLNEDIFSYESYCYLSDGIITYKDELFGFMDIEGNIIIEPQFQYAASFSEGLAYVEMVDGASGYIDKHGKLVLSLGRVANFSYGGDFTNNMAYIYDQKGKYGVIDNNGIWLVKPKYDKCTYMDEYNIWKLEYQRGDNTITDLYFVEMDKLIQNYDYIDIMTKTTFVGIKANKCYLVDVSDNQIVKYKFDNMGAGMSEGLNSVQRNGKHGYIDINGNLIIDFQFDDAKEFSGGLAAVCVDGKWGYIANPLIYPHWESEELQRARLLGLTPEDESGGIIRGNEFAELLAKVFAIDENELLKSGNHDTLTRKTAAELIAFVAERKGKYNQYYFPDCNDWHDISEISKHQTGFVIQTRIMMLQDSLFNERAEIPCDEAYEIVLRLYEYL